MRRQASRAFFAALVLALLTLVACVQQTPPTSNELTGGDNDLVEEAIPDADFVPRSQDYSETHPELPGVPVSFNTLVLVFEKGTKVGEARDLLEEIDAEIVGGIPGVEGQAEGILYLRVPVQGHEAMIDLLARLRADPLVKHVVQDGLLTTDLVPGPNGGSPAGWTWQAAPSGENWGMERIRAPQMWNLNAAVAKRGTTTPTGVLDVGFANSHEDLVYDQNLTVGNQADHGTHVAGTIAATFDNGVGVDGVTPFADLVVNAPAFSGSASSTMELRTSWGEQMSSGFFGLLDARDDVRVVNASLGYNWGRAGINQNTNTAVQDLVENQGAIFALAELIYVLLGNDLPVFVVSAGNDSNDISDGSGGWVLMDARWGSPYAYAGIELDMPNIIVVESVANSAASAGGATRSAFSNSGGDISAPGSDVWSTSWRSTNPSAFYERMSGTSMAAPHVTGLVSYLFSIDPTLLHSEIVDVLAANGVAVAGGASPRIDAFATVMDVDRVQGNDAVLRMLLDVDDGTPDGNQRILIPSKTVTDFTGEDADGDGGIGDGAIDMSDFRRWRDWLLQVEDPAGLTLNGSAGHPKKDVNGNGDVGTPAQENLYPRGDFNGDGQLSRSATRFVAGAIGTTVTDLAALQELFSDPNYASSDLPGLIDSADLEIWPADCLARPDIASVTSSIRITGTRTVLDSRTHTSAGRPRQIYTVPVDARGYTARIEAENASGATLFSEEASFSMPLGSDALWRPDCPVPPSFTITSYEFNPASPAEVPFSPVGEPCPAEGSVVVTGTYEKNVEDPVLIYARPYTDGVSTSNSAGSGSVEHLDLTGAFEQHFCIRDDVAQQRTVDQIRLHIERPRPSSELLFEQFVNVDYSFVRPELRSACIDFEDPPFVLDTRYGSVVEDSPGDVVFTEQGVPVSVEFFTQGDFTGFNHAQVRNDGNLAGQEMWITNINLKFVFSGLDFAVGQVRFAFEDLGGSENIAVNGSAIVEGEVASGTVGGVPLSIDRDGSVGEGTLSGAVTDLTIGGQEFYLDNVCAFEAD